MRIFTPVWGSKHLRLFDQALGRSLRWPRNKLSVSGAKWTILTDGPDDVGEIKRIIESITPNADVDIIEEPNLKVPGINVGVYSLSALNKALRKCIDADEPMLMATPDFIYGDGTIDVFKQLGSDPYSCVSIPHIRVLPSVLMDMDRMAEFSRLPPTNANLIDLAMRHPHTSWTHSQKDKRPNMSYRSGIKWQWVNSESMAVTHIMPSPFYVNFSGEDFGVLNYPYDNRPAGFGSWDHKWPKLLLQKGRLKLLGNSEMATMIEVTDHDCNVPPWNPDIPEDEFFNKDTHNRIQKQFVATFRRSSL